MNPSYNRDDNNMATTPALQLPDFTSLPGPNGEMILVPRYMVPLVESHLEGMRHIAEMPLDQAKNGVSLSLPMDYFLDIWIMPQPRRLPIYDSSIVAEGRLYADPEPVCPAYI
jgi:hypothetical protein